MLTVATGMAEHDRYARLHPLHTLRIKENLPYARISGRRQQRLSFAFRGNNKVREAMHSVFLYHAIRAGLDMAIVNAAQLPLYEEIDPELYLRAVEDVILCRDEGPPNVFWSWPRIKDRSGAERQTSFVHAEETWRGGS